MTVVETARALSVQFSQFARSVSARSTTAVGTAIIVLIVTAAVLGPELTPYSPVEQHLGNQLAPPSVAHPFGTDHLGRDVFTRVLYGARISLSIAVLVTTLRLLIGVSAGLVAGFLGGWADTVLMRIVDVQLAFPGIILALVIAGMLGPSLFNIMAALAVVGWSSYARVVRSSVLSLKQRSFVDASRLAGTSTVGICTQVLLPNVFSPVLVLATLNFGSVIVGIAGLSFIGLGAQPPTAEWGRMLSNGRPYVQSAWWIVNAPGASIFLTVAGFNLVGEGLRDTLDTEGIHR